MNQTSDGGAMQVEAFLSCDQIPASSIIIEKIGELVATIAAQHGLPGSFAPDDFLVDRGMTSMAMVDLMLAVEADFDITIPDRELTPSNFHSIEALSRLLDRL